MWRYGTVLNTPFGAAELLAVMVIKAFGATELCKIHYLAQRNFWLVMNAFLRSSAAPKPWPPDWMEGSRPIWWPWPWRRGTL